MIDIKKLTDKDIGRSVIYTSHPERKVVPGVITSFNSINIFVVYKRSQMGRGHATNPRDLNWIKEDENIKGK